MRLETLSDVKLTGRAIVAGWLDGFEDRKRRAVEAMFDIIENCDDLKMKREAFDALTRADIADQKRLEVALRRQAADDNKRLRLLEILGSLPAGEISKLASIDEGLPEG
jgi:hypothetical protein